METILENIKKLCSDRGISIRQMEQGCGLAPRYVYKWATAVPSVEKAATVADFFGISVDELIGREAPALEPGERQLLDLFRQMNAEGQTAAIEQLAFLAGRPAYIKSDPSIPTAAGAV